MSYNKYQARAEAIYNAKFELVWDGAEIVPVAVFAEILEAVEARNREHLLYNFACERSELEAKRKYGP